MSVQNTLNFVMPLYRPFNCDNASYHPTMSVPKLQRSFLAIAIVWALLAPNFCCAWSEPDEDGVDPYLGQYEQWIRQYNRNYRDEQERQQRYEIYKANVRLIESFNAVSNPFKLKDNEFADLTNWEFRDKFTRLKSSKQNKLKGEGTKPSPNMEHNWINSEDEWGLPPSVDWRENGAVTTIKNQGQCGSCWAFSAVAAIEGIRQIQDGELISLSEQELIDCDRKGENNGCQGGLMSTAFEFVKKNGGLTSDHDYPYEGFQDECQASNASHIATITGYQNVTINSEEDLLVAAARQPVSVGVDAGSFGWQFYSEGIYTGSCGTNLDHGVTVVGYGSEGVDKYWIVKNSWGKNWGEEGYIRMKRDVPSAEGLCGIAMMASYPLG